MGEIFKVGSMLMLVAIIAAVALGVVNTVTSPIIAEQKRLAKQNAMIDVAASLGEGELQFDSLTVPDLGNPYAEVDECLAVVSVADSNSTDLGYLFIAYGKGYSSVVQTMVALNTEGLVTATTVLYQQETPGLGANVSNPAKFLYQFNDKFASDLFLSKDGGQLDAITGSTITSRAVTNSVREGLEALIEARIIGGAL